MLHGLEQGAAMANARRNKSFPVIPFPSEDVSFDVLERCDKVIARCEQLWAEAAATIQAIGKVDRWSSEVRRGINKNYDTWPCIPRE
jgi:hypothetical protein